MHVCVRVMIFAENILKIKKGNITIVKHMSLNRIFKDMPKISIITELYSFYCFTAL